MKRGRRLGTTLHTSRSSGNLILKAEGDIKIGDTVLDGKGKKVGTVFDLFGPVSSPFAAVRPTIDDPDRYAGRPLFLKRSRR